MLNDVQMQYYEKIGKPTPKLEVMKFLKSKGYTDAKDYAGECEPVVIIAKGQSTNYRLSLHCHSFTSLSIQLTICILTWITDPELGINRCARNLQVWHTRRLHHGSSRCTVRICSGIILCHFFQRYFRSSHCQGGVDEERWSWRIC